MNNEEKFIERVFAPLTSAISNLTAAQKKLPLFVRTLVSDAVEKLRAEMSELRSKLLGEVQEKQVELIQSVADATDNCKTGMVILENNLQELRERIEALPAPVEGAAPYDDGDLKSQLATLAEAVGEVSKRIESQELAEEVQSLAIRSKAFEDTASVGMKTTADAMGSVSLRVEALDALLLDTKKTLGESIEGLNALVLSLTEQVKGIPNGISAEDLPAPYDPSSLFAGLDKTNGDLEALAAMVDGLAEVAAKQTQEVMALRVSIPAPVELPEPFDPSGLTAKLMEVQEGVAKLAEGQNSIAARVEEVKATIPVPVELPAPFDPAPVTEMITGLGGRLDDFAKDLRELIVEAEVRSHDRILEVSKSIPTLPEPPAPFDPADIVSSINERIEFAVNGVETALMAQEKEFTQRISQLEQAHKEQLDALRKDAEESIAKALQSVEAKAAQVTIIEPEVPVYSMAMAEEEDGTLRLRLMDGEVEKASSIIKAPTFGYRGVYSPALDSMYKAGDSVTHSGSLWMAMQDSPGRPAEGSSGWRLAVKKGQDGRNGQDGASVAVYDEHAEGAKYRKGDILHLHGRIWHCRKGTVQPPEAAQITSSGSWSLLGYSI